MNEPNAYGNTPLHVACYNGQDVVVNELIECGANVNQVNEKGFAPLHFTAASRHGALCLELLVGNGADVNIKVGPLLELHMYETKITIEFDQINRGAEKNQNRFDWLFIIVFSLYRVRTVRPLYI